MHESDVVSHQNIHCEFMKVLTTETSIINFKCRLKYSLNLCWFLWHRYKVRNSFAGSATDSVWYLFLCQNIWGEGIFFRWFCFFKGKICLAQPGTVWQEVVWNGPRKQWIWRSNWCQGDNRLANFPLVWIVHQWDWYVCWCFYLWYLVS